MSKQATTSTGTIASPGDSTATAQGTTSRADDPDTTDVNEYSAEVLGVPPVCTVPVTMLSPTITEAGDYYAAVAGRGEIGNVTLRVVPRQDPSLSRVSASLSDFSRADDSQASQRKVKVTSTVNNARYTTVYMRWKQASSTSWTTTDPVKTGGILFASDTSEHVITGLEYNTRYDVQMSLSDVFTGTVRSTQFTTPSQLPAPESS